MVWLRLAAACVLVGRRAGRQRRPPPTWDTDGRALGPGMHVRGGCSGRADAHGRRARAECLGQCRLGCQRDAGRRLCSSFSTRFPSVSSLFANPPTPPGWLAGWLAGLGLGAGPCTPLPAPRPHLHPSSTTPSDAEDAAKGRNGYELAGNRLRVELSRGPGTGVPRGGLERVFGSRAAA